MAACNASLLNKDRLENAVLRNVQEQILTEDNVRRYIEMAVEQSKAPFQDPTGEEKAVSLAIGDIETRLRRWEDVLERGLLSLEDAAADYDASPGASILIENQSGFGTKFTLGTQDSPHPNVIDECLY